MTVYTFRLRPDMPEGFRKNEQYPELPATVKFLRKFEGIMFGSEDIFRGFLSSFPEYLSNDRIPESSDKALREGLFLEKIEGVLNVYTKSDESRARKCWFGSFGTEDKLREYFEKQRQARTREIDEEDDD